MITEADIPNRIQELETENAELRRQLSEREERDRQAVADEESISAKMSHGLSREQAVAVIKRQRAFDEGKAAEKAARREKLGSLLTGRESLAEAVSRARKVFPDQISATVIRDEVEEFMRSKAAK